jgi:Ras-related protein Rab-11A
MEECDFTYKVVVIGDSGVGKSNLLTRYVRNEFSFKTKPTVGVDFFWKLTEVCGKKVKAQIWDTAGQERYKAFSSSYYHGAHAAVITYDVTDKKSFLNVMSWVKEIDSHTELERMAIILVGNKTDLCQLRQVQTIEGEQLARKLGFFFLETSALLDMKGEVAKAFEIVIERRIILNKRSLSI